MTPAETCDVFPSHCDPAMHDVDVGSHRSSQFSGSLLLPCAVIWTVQDFGLVEEEMPGRVKEPEMFQTVVVTMCACSWFACCSSLRKGLRTAVCREDSRLDHQRGQLRHEEAHREHCCKKPSSDDP